MNYIIVHYILCILDGNSSGAPNLNSLMSMANNMLGNMSQNQSSKPKPTQPPRDEGLFSCTKNNSSAINQHCAS